MLQQYCWRDLCCTGCLSRTDMRCESEPKGNPTEARVEKGYPCPRGSWKRKEKSWHVPWTVMPNAASRSNRSINPRHIFINISEGCPRRASYPFSSPSCCPRDCTQSHVETHTQPNWRLGEKKGREGSSWRIKAPRSTLRTPINTHASSGPSRPLRRRSR